MHHRRADADLPREGVEKSEEQAGAKRRELGIGFGGGTQRDHRGSTEGRRNGGSKSGGQDTSADLDFGPGEVDHQGEVAAGGFEIRARCREMDILNVLARLQFEHDA